MRQNYRHSLFYETFDEAERSEAWLRKNGLTDVHASDQGEGSSPMECRFYTPCKIVDVDVQDIIRAAGQLCSYEFNAED